VSADYVLRSRWRVQRSRQSLWDVLEALLATDDPLPWWPAVEVLGYDGDDLRLRASSHLGYALKFTLSDLRSHPPDRLTFRADGDLSGRGEVAFVDDGPSGSALEIDWRVDTSRPWMRRTSWLLRPVFVLGHHLVMRQGERRLNAWLATQA
jgi:hypothetical protein